MTSHPLVRAGGGMSLKHKHKRRPRVTTLMIFSREAAAPPGPPAKHYPQPRRRVTINLPLPPAVPEPVMRPLLSLLALLTLVPPAGAQDKVPVRLFAEAE